MSGYDWAICSHAKSMMQRADDAVFYSERIIVRFTGMNGSADTIAMHKGNRDFYKQVQKLCDRTIRKHCHDEEVPADPNPEDPTEDRGSVLADGEPGTTVA